MLSKLQIASGVFRRFQTGVISDSKLKTNLISKRWSGHNVMNIEPTNHDWHFAKNWFHFYALLTAIPLAIVSTIANIRANPELTEIPEGYEPRHWEYFQHPITRFFARYFYYPPEYEFEMRMAEHEYNNEGRIYNKMARRVEEVMKFYNDHRTMYWSPGSAEYYRAGRDQFMAGYGYILSNTNENLENAYDPDYNAVPTEGMVRKDE